MSLFLYLLLLFLSVFGICELIHSTRLFFLRVRKIKGKALVLKLSKGTAETQLRFVLEQYRWHGESYADEVIVVSYLQDGPELEICRQIAIANGIKFFSNEEFINYISSGEFNANG